MTSVSMYVSLQACKLAIDQGWAINVGGGFGHYTTNIGGGLAVYDDVLLCLAVGHCLSTIIIGLTLFTYMHNCPHLKFIMSTHVLVYWPVYIFMYLAQIMSKYSRMKHILVINFDAYQVGDTL